MFRSPLAKRLDLRGQASWRASDGSEDVEVPAKAHKLVLYSKQGCCLCEGLQEKLDSVFAAAQFTGQLNLANTTMEVRDIAEKKEWEQKYEYEVPVLTWLDPDDAEVPIPRFPPRLAAERIGKKLEEILSSL
ncbi:hypothetical protein CYMTET_6119 [Cymbomonas tetramitiformis]|uniref:Glutaredoxin-like protein n=1 Tax=Cymbomonas tetramitiformis TaxID=36881 RepID=A0AAE0GY35_9CHLO|nr:hypothetical protein CYMTET_6119 [Cymbomonas tetramitiformis]